MTGREADFGELFRRDADALYRFALLRLRDGAEAEDAVQDAFIRLLRRGDDPSNFDHPRAWMFQVLDSVCIDRRRALNRRGRVFIDSDQDADEFPDNRSLSTEKNVAIGDELRGALRALGALSEVDAAALALVAIEGMSYAEVAEIVSVPIGTVRSRVSRARQSLRQMRDGAEMQGGTGESNVVSMPNRKRRGSE